MGVRLVKQRTFQEVKVPVIVVGCKLDLRDEQYPMSLEQVMAPIMQQYREIETCIECSAANLVQMVNTRNTGDEAAFNVVVAQAVEALMPDLRTRLLMNFVRLNLMLAAVGMLHLPYMGGWRNLGSKGPSLLAQLTLLWMPKTG
ncbi:hypothetical protein CTI12_AA093790 [Artemisia annua]|uniref:Uncharacterized protein n=1 Tax=Artemisia annua TaxID=35608 RepID=A0A2U1PZ94_ARTAN|nr:hypothetical protein CTI12_AA093790 [Artemisia annua]